MSVYPGEIVIDCIDCNDKEGCRQDLDKFMTKIFGARWNGQGKSLELEITGQKLFVSYESMEMSDAESSSKMPPPLFQNVIYFGTKQPENFPQKSQRKVPVVVFHSYKGGVGRTLSALSLTRGMSLKSDATGNLKTLLVDADIEAPGLTWLAECDSMRKNGFWNPQISYLDVLSIIHSSDNAALQSDIPANVAENVSTSTIDIPANDIFKEHFFLPAYRYREQLFSASFSPENIVSMPERAFVIADFLSSIADKLGCDAVIVDLRAGLTNLSAPLLFDPWAQKVFVTSTSYQSVTGTKLLLDYICRPQFNLKESPLEPTVLVTMVPQAMDKNKLDSIKADLAKAALIIPHGTSNLSSSENEDSEEITDALLSDVVLSASFTEQLLHLEGLEDTCGHLAGTDMEHLSKELLRRMFANVVTSENTAEKRALIMRQIKDVASQELTAEGSNDIQNMLLTASLERLIRDYRNKLPRLVIEGAKGSGKTYIYRQLLKRKFWEKFVAVISDSNREEQNGNTVIMPLLSSKNRANMGSDIQASLESVNQLLGIQIPQDIINLNECMIENAMKNSLSQFQWSDVWMKLIHCTLSPGNDNMPLEDIDQKLSETGGKILLIVDGLDDLFVEALSSEFAKAAIRALCQDVINRISYYTNIGIIIFIRKDMTKNAITTNYDQFKSQYSSYSLNWSQDEALRLVIWILSIIGFKDYSERKNDIPKLTRKAMEEKLYPFWGKKLGKDNSNEAFSHRWILAALSDFNGQLQARDIVRFLKYATEEPVAGIYTDRILMPLDVRKTISPCSLDKIEEFTSEIKDLGRLFEELKNIDNADKELPLNMDIVNFDENQRKQLEEFGFLKMQDGKYYLPEIVRNALGYRYSKGARPKVLALSLGR
jgi:MinD-like ATPase involved in chromosome partitioning or flagellar assembly